MKKLLCLLLVISISLTSMACSQNEKTSESTKEKTTLTLGILPDTQSVPIALANYLGYFKDEGVDIKVEKFTSAPERDSALQSGALDGAISDLISVMLFCEGGFNVKTTSITDGSQEFIVGANSGITDANSIKGATIGLSENTVMEYACDRFLTNLKLDPNTAITKTYIPQITVRMEMLEAGQLDGSVMPEPQVSVGKAGGAKVLISSNDLNMHTTGIAFSTDAIKDKKAEIEVFYRGYNRAVEYINTHEVAEYIDIIIKETGFPESVTETITLPTYVNARLPFKEDIKAVNDWMLAKDLIAKAYEYNTVVDTGFCKE